MTRIRRLILELAMYGGWTAEMRRLVPSSYP